MTAVLDSRAWRTELLMEGQSYFKKTWEEMLGE